MGVLILLTSDALQSDGVGVRVPGISDPYSSR